MTNRFPTVPSSLARATGPASIAGTQSYCLRSRIVDQEYVIDVAAPRGSAPPGHRYPVVYVLDGNGTFGMTAQTARLLQLARELPPLVVVGIGYRFDEAADTLGRLFAVRTRDLAPCVDHSYVEQGSAAPAPFTHPTEISAGQADRFARFLNEELKPFIASRYAIDASDQTLAGVSLGSLFVLHTLFTAPATFRRYLAGSPSIWWNDGELFREEANLAASASDLPVNLFLSAGELEERDAPTYRPVTNMEDLAGRLTGRHYPGLKLGTHVFSGESHASVVPATISRGLRVLFQG